MIYSAPRLYIAVLIETTCLIWFSWLWYLDNSKLELQFSFYLNGNIKRCRRKLVFFQALAVFVELGKWFANRYWQCLLKCPSKYRWQHMAEQNCDHMSRFCNYPSCDMYYIQRNCQFVWTAMRSKVVSNSVFGSFWLIFLCTAVQHPLVIICHRASPKTGAQAKMFLPQNSSGFMGWNYLYIFLLPLI